MLRCSQGGETTVPSPDMSLGLCHRWHPERSRGLHWLGVAFAAAAAEGDTRHLGTGKPRESVRVRGSRNLGFEKAI